MKALVNEECILCGICVDMCPDVFELGDELAFVKTKNIETDFEDCCLDAAEECPVDAIEINS